MTLDRAGSAAGAKDAAEEAFGLDHDDNAQADNRIDANEDPSPIDHGD